MTQDPLSVAKSAANALEGWSASLQGKTDLGDVLGLVSSSLKFFKGAGVGLGLIGVGLEIFFPAEDEESDRDVILGAIDGLASGLFQANADLEDLLIAVEKHDDKVLDESVLKLPIGRLEEAFVALRDYQNGLRAADKMTGDAQSDYLEALELSKQQGLDQVTLQQLKVDASLITSVLTTSVDGSDSHLSQIAQLYDYRQAGSAEGKSAFDAIETVATTCLRYIAMGLIVACYTGQRAGLTDGAKLDYAQMRAAEFAFSGKLGEPAYAEKIIEEWKLQFAKIAKVESAEYFAKREANKIEADTIEGLTKSANRLSGGLAERWPRNVWLVVIMSDEGGLNKWINSGNHIDLGYFKNPGGQKFQLVIAWLTPEEREAQEAVNVPGSEYYSWLHETAPQQAWKYPLQGDNYLLHSPTVLEIRHWFGDGFTILSPASSKVGFATSDGGRVASASWTRKYQSTEFLAAWEHKIVNMRDTHDAEKSNDPDEDSRSWWILFH